MGGIIDFDTSCPWELYLFAFVHLAGGIVMWIFDSCRLLTSTSCTPTEKVMESFVVLSFLYVGVIYTVLTYHNKTSAPKIMRLSNIALHCAVALLTSVIFTGNASFVGGIERSWMHKGDMLTMIILIAVLYVHITKTDAEWAQKNPIGDDLGVNCKTLLLLFLVLTAFKFVAYTDYIDPMKLLAEGSEMTYFGVWMWKILAVMIFEVFLAILYAVMFDDEAGQELLVFAIIAMSVISAGFIASVQKYMSSWMGMNSNALWIRLGIFIIVCIVAVIGGRRGSSGRSGYQTV